MGALDLIKGAGNLSIGQILRSCPKTISNQYQAIAVHTSEQLEQLIMIVLVVCLIGALLGFVSGLTWVRKRLYAASWSV